MKCPLLLALAVTATACGTSADGDSDDAGHGGSSSSTGGATSTAGGGSSSGGSGGAGAAVGTGAGAGAGGAPPTVYERIDLNFDDLPSGTLIVDQYDDYVTITSQGECGLQTWSGDGVASSQPNSLTTYFTCNGGANAPIFIDFTTPVKRPSVTVVGANNSTKVATLRLVLDDGSTREEDVTGLGNPYEPVVVDLSDEPSGVTRLEIVDVEDAYGLGIDDVSFDFPTSP